MRRYLRYISELYIGVTYVIHRSYLQVYLLDFLNFLLDLF